ncbi:hypothetical protein [Nonomuraea rubra]
MIPSSTTWWVVDEVRTVAPLIPIPSTVVYARPDRSKARSRFFSSTA